MIIKEQDLELLEEAVANGQFRLADTRFLEVIVQLVEAVSEMKFKLDLIEDFLSSDEDNEQEVTENLEETQQNMTKQEVVVGVEDQEIELEKPKSKTKPKQEELNTKE
jgi:nucleotide-binding universal stress UspA family protein